MKRELKLFKIGRIHGLGVVMDVLSGNDGWATQDLPHPYNNNNI